MVTNYTKYRDLTIQEQNLYANPKLINTSKLFVQFVTNLTQKKLEEKGCFVNQLLTKIF